ncbi:MAG: coiled-coil protein [Candidatus Nitrosocosmicus sp.]
MVQEQTGGNSAIAPTAAASASATKKDSRINNSIDSNQKTLLEFKKALLEEQKNGESQIEKINQKIEETKKIIDDERVKLEAERLKLKHTNEAKDADYSKFTELRNSLIEERKRMKTLDSKASGTGGGFRSRRDRHNISNLTRTLEQIERDIQTKKLSKDEERRLVLKSKEIATKLHTLKIINKKEDTYKNMAMKFDDLKGKMTQIFDQKAEIGKGIGKLKANLDELLNKREELYEERRSIIHQVREAGAKLEMVDTQLNAIEFKKSRLQYASDRHRRQNDRERDRDRRNKHEIPQDKMRKSRENQELWNSLKEVAMKKMVGGEKLTFDEMKLIYSDESD